MANLNKIDHFKLERKKQKQKKKTQHSSRGIHVITTLTTEFLLGNQEFK